MTALNKKFSAETIRHKFFSTIALVLTIGTMVLCATIAIHESIAQNDLLIKKGKGLAQYVAKISQDPLIMKDDIQLDSIVNEAKYDDDILYTIIVDGQGEITTSQFSSINYNSSIITKIKSEFRGLNELPEIIKYINDYRSTIEISSPIVTGNETIGKVVVCVSKQNIVKNILSTMTFIVALNILIALVLAAILFMVSQRIIFAPISELADASRRLAKGDLATRLTITTVGEMQELVATFNQMAEDIQKTTVSKNYVNNIIKSMTEALLILSPTYVVQDVNDASYRLLGYEYGTLAGIEAGAFFEEELLAPITSGTQGRIGAETVCTRKDGTTLPIFLSASAMLNEAGTIEGIVCNALDISKMKQVYQELEDTNKTLKQEVAQRKQAQEEAAWLNDDLERQKIALEAANRELESFCYSVSHDLRAPLRHINGFTTILSEDYRDGLDDMGKDCLDRICAASKNMGTLIDDLLRFSRVSRAELQVVAVDLSKAAQQIARMFTESEPNCPTRIEIEEGLTATGDSSLLDMVLQNLIGNAWKYSARNPNAVISVGRCTIDNEQVFFVRDNGVGFDMKYQDKLFQVFERLHGEDFEGTGIGLATVHRIIERHGGRIWADGVVGKGATFFFTLGGSN
ncbi:HAMP domain-containing protein [Geobacter pelophilus]|uniref:histidine kinase n=1 Tax=Geoanaerobacter pelophilus TaxID=60036 RepID=A0AAW4L4X2_9BACT|nr:ATP-binding protein [Geoanaerobacter pelophilus]MBT0664860.1 HAMP domain-containing protein [Geoanaerobacter pelophilus]